MLFLECFVITVASSETGEVSGAGPTGAHTSELGQLVDHIAVLITPRLKTPSDLWWIVLHTLNPTRAQSQQEIDVKSLPAQIRNERAVLGQRFVGIFVDR